MVSGNEKVLADTQRISQEAEQMDVMHDGSLRDLYLLNITQRLTNIENRLRERISDNTKKLDSVKSRLDKKLELIFKPKVKRELQFEMAKMNSRLACDISRLGKLHQIIDNKEYLDREVWKKIEGVKEKEKEEQEIIKKEKQRIEEKKILAAKIKREQDRKKETLGKSRARTMAIKIPNR